MASRDRTVRPRGAHHSLGLALAIGVSCFVHVGVASRLALGADRADGSPSAVREAITWIEVVAPEATEQRSPLPAEPAEPEPAEPAARGATSPPVDRAPRSARSHRGPPRLRLTAPGTGTHLPGLRLAPLAPTPLEEQVARAEPAGAAPEALAPERAVAEPGPDTRSNENDSERAPTAVVAAPVPRAPPMIVLGEPLEDPLADTPFAEGREVAVAMHVRLEDASGRGRAFWIARTRGTAWDVRARVDAFVTERDVPSTGSTLEGLRTLRLPDDRVLLVAGDGRFVVCNDSDVTLGAALLARAARDDDVLFEAPLPTEVDGAPSGGVAVIVRASARAGLRLEWTATFASEAEAEAASLASIEAWPDASLALISAAPRVARTGASLRASAVVEPDAFGALAPWIATVLGRMREGLASTETDDR